MKKIFLLLIAACFGVVASAQKVYFLYLQSEDLSPFYVRVGNKIHNSASSGFLILPNLVDTTYYLSLGFSKSIEPEAKFSVAINENDRGFLIKKFEDGLALFDLEESALVKSNSASKDNTVYLTKADVFSNVLSKAAGDPSIVKVPVAKMQEVAKPEKKEAAPQKSEEKMAEKLTTENTGNDQPEKILATNSILETKTIASSSSTDSVALPKEPTIVQHSSVKKEESTGQEVFYKSSVVSRRSESSTTEGFGIVYLDKMSESTDTIRILIPASKVKLVENDITSSEVQEKAVKSDEKIEVKKRETIGEGKVDQPLQPIKNHAVCKSIASEKDFMKLRKRMAAKETDEAMIDEAKKEFKTRCYSVEQVRYLSTLFLTSAAKYQFFDAAYDHVTEKNGFSSLVAELKDEHYVKRFKALIGE